MNDKLIKSIMIFSFIGILFSIWLVAKDLKMPGFCPKFIFIPACYPALLSYLFVYISTYMKASAKKERFFFFGASLGIIIGFILSLRQILGYSYCPLFFGLPLCYVSFLTFLYFLIVNIIKIIVERKKDVKSVNKKVE